MPLQLSTADCQLCPLLPSGPFCALTPVLPAVAHDAYALYVYDQGHARLPFKQRLWESV